MKANGFFPVSILFVLLAAAYRNGAPTPKLEPDRSPTDVVLSSNGTLALTTNSTSDTVSLIDLSGRRVVTEVPVGKRPFGIALSSDGRLAAVTNFRSGTLSLLEVSPSALHVEATLPVGHEPRGVALSPDGKTAYVALSGEHRLAVVDIPQRKVTAQIAVGTEPWHVALTPDGKRLAVGSTRSQEMAVIDTVSREVAYSVKLRGRNVRHLAISPDGEWAYTPTISEQGRPTTQEDIDNGWVVANRLARVSLKEEAPREAIALDPRGTAIGDADGVALSPDGKSIALTAGGTHELLLLRHPLNFMSYGGPADHIDPNLLKDSSRFRRVALGGRPLGVRFTPDGKEAVVANYLGNSVQIIDFETGQVTKTISLGGPAQPSLARQGETLFLDATRSFHQWYSCNTCHTEGHTNGGNFDTFNDGSYYTSKKTLSLRGVTETGPPYTWHGWQNSLHNLVHDSFTKSMQGPEPKEEEITAVIAYLKTLTPPTSPYRNPDGSLTAQAKRGEKVFLAKGCDTCHAPPLYMSNKPYKVGLEGPNDAYVGFKPPSLRNVYSRSPYLHDGRARNLEEVLTKHHRASQLTGKPDPNPNELADLVAFLRSL